MTTQERLLNIANRKLDKPQPLSPPDLTKPLKDAGIDSLDFLLVLVAVQEEFSVNIPDNLVPEFSSLADLAAFLEKNNA